MAALSRNSHCKDTHNNPIHPTLVTWTFLDLNVRQFLRRGDQCDGYQLGWNAIESNELLYNALRLASQSNLHHLPAKKVYTRYYISYNETDLEVRRDGQWLDTIDSAQRHLQDVSR